jgi:hypothetical protein
MTLEGRVFVDRPVEEVFARLLDLERSPAAAWSVYGANGPPAGISIVSKGGSKPARTDCPGDESASSGGQASDAAGSAVSVKSMWIKSQPAVGTVRDALGETPHRARCRVRYGG